MFSIYRMSCPICIEPFGQRHHRVVQCPYCDFQACHDCVGRYLLENDGCMGCRRDWSYDVITSLMTKKYMNTEYKQHIKDMLFREIEQGLGAYQEIAVLSNKKEDLLKQLSNTDRCLRLLEEEKTRRVAMDVIFLGRVYRIAIVMDKKIVESRKGAYIIRHIENMTNPLPTEQDKIQTREKVETLTREKLYFRLMHAYAVLNLNMSYTDKVLIAWSADMNRRELSVTEREECLKMLEITKTDFDKLQQENEVLYGQCIQTGSDSELFAMMDRCRKASRTFWKHYFRAFPPTAVDFKKLQDDKIHFSKEMEIYKEKMMRITWEIQDTHFNSNQKYLYNLDDQQLTIIDQDDHNHDHAISILEKEETKYKEFLEEYQKEVDRLTPIYNDLIQQYTIVKKEWRMASKHKNVHGHAIMNCPWEDCVGKLKENGNCGLCGRLFCQDCMCLEQEGHMCRPEDKETVSELKRTTRPCPKCHILISKIEGCDQMWCVQCHTTFSWKTGVITRGVVHNPHFYDYRREAMQQHRAPGDIPCGGLPNEIEMIDARNKENRPFMYEMWQYMIVISEKWMPSIYRRFHNVRPVRYRQYSISYLRGKMDKKRVGVLLHKNYLDEIRYASYYTILETLVDNMAEYMRRHVYGDNTLQECRQLLDIADQDIADLNKKYHIHLRRLSKF